MVLDLEKVKEVFSLYSGEDPEDTGPRGRLCARLCEECAGRLGALPNRRGTPGESGALESWAAAEAFYQLALADEANSPESVSADGVTVKEGGRAQKARALAEEKRKAAAVLVGEEGFYFGRA